MIKMKIVQIKFKTNIKNHIQRKILIYFTYNINHNPLDDPLFLFQYKAQYNFFSSIKKNTHFKNNSQ